MRRLWLALVLALAVPRTADAGLLDIIWQMSGPQLLGVLFQFEIGIKPEQENDVVLFGKQLAGPSALRARSQNEIWVLLDGRVYVSTGRNADEGAGEVDFRFNGIRMVGLDPMLAFRLPIAAGDWRFHYAAGFSLNRLFGPDVDAFNNWAYKIRVLGVDRRFGPIVLGGGYNVRIYPNGFESIAAPQGSVKLSGQTEVVQGFLLDFRWGGGS